MNEWEIIGRFVDLDNRLRTLEGRPTVQEKPQPVATLCEAVDKAIRFIESHVDENYSREILAAMRHALTAERKRAVLVESVIENYRILVSQRSPHNGHTIGECDFCDDLFALDAFDKGAENG